MAEIYKEREINGEIEEQRENLRKKYRERHVHRETQTQKTERKRGGGGDFHWLSGFFYFVFYIS